MKEKRLFKDYFSENGTTIEKMAKVEGFPFSAIRMYQIDKEGVTDIKLSNAISLYKITSKMFPKPLNVWDILSKKNDKRKK